MPDLVEKKVFDLLDQERQALREGDFETLDTLLERKTLLFQDLEKQGTSPKTLTVVQRKLIENQTLLSAAIDGVNAACARLAALQNVREGLNTYDRAGQIAKVSTVRPAIEKKA